MWYVASFWCYFSISCQRFELVTPTNLQHFTITNQCSSHPRQQNVSINTNMRTTKTRGCLTPHSNRINHDTADWLFNRDLIPTKIVEYWKRINCTVVLVQLYSASVTKALVGPTLLMRFITSHYRPTLYTKHLQYYNVIMHLRNWMWCVASFWCYFSISCQRFELATPTNLQPLPTCSTVTITTQCQDNKT